MSERGSVRFGTTEIHYQVLRSARRQKTVTLSVGKEGLTVRAPLRTPARELQELVRQRGAWVLAKQTHLEELHAQLAPPKRFVSGESLSYLGHAYRLKLVEGLEQVQLQPSYLLAPRDAPERVRDSLVAWYKRQAEAKLAERVRIYSARIGVTPTKLLIRDQRKRWGSCNGKGEVRLNWRIMMAPVSLIDYVVVHELVHLEHMNHSKAYWKRVGEILPDFRDRQKRLMALGASLDF